MKALVIGATGAIGKDLVEQLLRDDRFDRVDIFVRREVGTQADKLAVHVVDFDQPSKWADQLTGDVLFSTLGTTLKAAGGKSGQWKVDYTYQLDAAKAACKNGVPTYVLVSSIGANSRSKVFYTRMKGELEDAVKTLGFRDCFILQPPSLIRKGSDRFGEKVGVAGLKVFNAIGLMRAWKPMRTEDVAAAMIRLATSGRRGIETVVSQDILKADFGKYITELNHTHQDEAIRLVKKVFMQFEAPEYSREGIREFMDSIHNQDYLIMHSFFGAYVHGKLAGVIATRKGHHHVGLLFVDRKYQKKGIGRMLMQYVIDLKDKEPMTVNASPYAHEFYKKLGFTDTDGEQTVSGIRFYPMILES